MALDLEALGGGEAGGEERGGEQEVGDGAVGPEAPLVVRPGHGAGEPGCHPSPGEGDVVDDCCPADAGDQAKSNDKGCPAHKPESNINIAYLQLDR